MSRHSMAEIPHQVDAGTDAQAAVDVAEVVFDRPTAAVSTAMLHELYATEGRTLPVQGVEAAAPERAPNVLVLRRPGCQ